MCIRAQVSIGRMVRQIVEQFDPGTDHPFWLAGAGAASRHFRQESLTNKLLETKAKMFAA
jgi:hypothetical protein